MPSERTASVIMSIGLCACTISPISPKLALEQVQNKKRCLKNQTPLVKISDPVGTWNHLLIPPIHTTYTPFSTNVTNIWSHIGLNTAKVTVISYFANYTQWILNTKSQTASLNPYNTLIINSIVEIVPNYLFSYYFSFFFLIFLILI